MSALKACVLASLWLSSFAACSVLADAAPDAGVPANDDQASLPEAITTLPVDAFDPAVFFWEPEQGESQDCALPPS